MTSTNAETDEQPTGANKYDQHQKGPSAFGLADAGLFVPAMRISQELEQKAATTRLDPSVQFKTNIILSAVCCIFSSSLSLSAHVVLTEDIIDRKSFAA